MKFPGQPAAFKGNLNGNHEQGESHQMAFELTPTLKRASPPLNPHRLVEHKTVRIGGQPEKLVEHLNTGWTPICWDVPERRVFMRREVVMDAQLKKRLC